MFILIWSFANTPLLIRKGLTVNQNILLFIIPPFCSFLKHCPFAFLLYEFFFYLCFISLKLRNFSEEGHFIYLFSTLIIGLLSSFFMKGVWFPLTFFCFIKAWWSNFFFEICWEFIVFILTFFIKITLYKLSL